MLMLLSFTLTSCWVYKPQLADIPLIDHQGDVRLNGSVYVQPLISQHADGSISLLAVPGVSTTVSAGLTDRLAVQSHFDFQGHCYTHIALGLYKPFANSLLESYVGVGYGTGGASDNDEPASSHINYLCPFVQGNYGWRLGKHFDIGMALKAGDYIPVRYTRSRKPEYDSGNPSLPGHTLLVEPQVFFRVGWETVKLQLQAGYSLLAGWPREYLFGYYPVSLGVGVSISL